MSLTLSLVSVFGISLISLIGVFTFSIKENLIKKYIFLFVSLAVGALLGDAFIHLIPEGLEEISNPLIFSLLIISGILLFFIIEKYIHWHHHCDIEEGGCENKPVGKMILLSDAMHNFIDGLIIGASYLVSPAIGLATTVAVILHEIPQEIGDFAILLHSGFSRSKALFLNFMTALTSVLGVIAVFAFSELSEIISLWLIPIAAGGFIYIAMSDLIPELHQKMEKKSYLFWQIFMILLGISSMLLLLLLE
jgi:zinc and cadmium transporter